MRTRLKKIHALDNVALAAKVQLSLPLSQPPLKTCSLTSVSPTKVLVFSDSRKNQ
jgi:hypothetical protein